MNFDNLYSSIELIYNIFIILYNNIFKNNNICELTDDTSNDRLNKSNIDEDVVYNEIYKNSIKLDDFENNNVNKNELLKKKLNNNNIYSINNIDSISNININDIYDIEKNNQEEQFWNNYYQSE
jgi:hypothetical protein